MSGDNSYGYDLAPELGPVIEDEPDVRRRAVRAVASSARDAADAVWLLTVLGLTAAEGL